VLTSCVRAGSPIKTPLIDHIQRENSSFNSIVVRLLLIAAVGRTTGMQFVSQGRRADDSGRSTVSSIAATTAVTSTTTTTTTTAIRLDADDDADDDSSARRRRSSTTSVRQPFRVQIVVVSVCCVSHDDLILNVFGLQSFYCMRRVPNPVFILSCLFRYGVADTQEWYPGQ
jgi:cytochrome bd-type quinol oxidase subunit 2